MKTSILLILITVVTATIFIVPTFTSVATNLKWKRQVYQYWDLSDRASTIELKLNYILKFKNALEVSHLNEGQSVYVFTNEATDLGNNMIILNTLIERMESTLKLSKDSLEYQQAIKQITTDEYQGFNTCVFANGWRRQSFIRWWYSPFIRCQKGKYAGEQNGY